MVPDTDWPETLLHVVSGKGGTGKSTVAAALALSLAQSGRRVMLMEVEGRQGIAQMFDTPPLPHEERRIASAANGGEVWALAVEPEEALLEYLELFYNLRRAGSVLRKMGAIEFVTTVAPGLRDVLLTGKAIELTRRKAKGISPAYDAVVLDAPPTGRITRFLNVNTEVAGLAKVGPIRSQADSVMSVLRSKRTAIHLVTLLEEMPVQETLDGIAEIQGAALPVGSIIVNMRRPHVPHERDIVELTDQNQISAALLLAGLDQRKAVIADVLLSEAREHAARLEMESVERARIAETGLPVYDLPAISGGIDTAALYELAVLLNEQGLA
jgi:anion-transporting  ArsA/GET3 family ATPase